MNKVYLLLVIADNRIEFDENGIPQRPRGPVDSWVLNGKIGINTLSGFKLTEKEARSWAKERCRFGEELPDRPVSEKIVPVEQYIYVDHQCVLMEPPDRLEKRVVFKGYRREGLELPIFGYIELFERPKDLTP